MTLRAEHSTHCGGGDYGSEVPCLGFAESPQLDDTRQRVLAGNLIRKNRLVRVRLGVGRRSTRQVSRVRTVRGNHSQQGSAARLVIPMQPLDGQRINDDVRNLASNPPIRLWWLIVSLAVALTHLYRPTSTARCGRFPALPVLGYLDGRRAVSLASLVWAIGAAPISTLAGLRFDLHLPGN